MVCLDVIAYAGDVEADAVGLASDRDRGDQGGASGESGLKLRRDRRVVRYPAVFQQYRPDPRRRCDGMRPQARQT